MRNKNAKRPKTKKVVPKKVRRVTKTNSRNKKTTTRKSIRTNTKSNRRVKTQKGRISAVQKRKIFNSKPVKFSRNTKRITTKSSSVSKTRKNSIKKKSKSNSAGLEKRIKSSKFKVYQVKDQTFDERLNYELELYNKDKIDLSDLKDQDRDAIFSMLVKYFNRLYKKLEDPKQHFSLLVKYFEGTYTNKKGYNINNEFDFVSTPVTLWENMPEQMHKDLKALIELFLTKVNEYKKFQANFILESVSIQIFNDL